MAGSQGPERDGKVGAKVRRVAHVGLNVRRADRSKVLEGRSAATRSKVAEGSSERPASRSFDRVLSPAGGTLQIAVAWRGPCSSA